MPAVNWKSLLAEHPQTPLAQEIAAEVDVFETQMELRRQGKLEEKVFAETRLRRGIYGQRYDNGKRHDGVATQTLAFPCGDLTKGPDTVWDAPGMVRIKIPMGVTTCDQLDVMAELAEEYSDAILHVTTRQDIQLHYVHIEDTPDLMRRLAAVDITTREACGNSVRNVTACPYAGVCNDQSFDVTPYAHALTYYLLGHKDAQDFGRKFKIAFSGCRDHACGLAMIHDIGAVAVTKTIDGAVVRGFELYVGGGLGSVPHQAKLLADFVPEGELLPLSQAICRVFARLGERKNRARARLKFVVAKLGIDEFRRVVEAEREIIPADDRWTAYLDGIDRFVERPLRPGKALGGGIFAKGFEPWRQTNVRPQAQPGYVAVTVKLPLGDLTSDQARQLSDIARQFTGDTMRLTVEQNILLRWVVEAELPALYTALVSAGLASAGAATISDITSCPGTDTCKLGIASSRGLSAELGARLESQAATRPDEISALRIKASGCFNSCGQHHIADIGFLGVSRTVAGRRVAHFQLVVGGEWNQNGGAFGLAIGAFPSKRIPEVVDRLTGHYLKERLDGEALGAFITRAGRGSIKAVLDDLRHVPTYEEDPSFYVDWGDAREYTIGDMGVGECAGEVVSFAEFGLADSERQVFEAQLEYDRGAYGAAARLSFAAMVEAARALVRLEFTDVAEDSTTVVSEFRARFYDTKRFFDPFAGGKFAQALFQYHETPAEQGSAEAVRQAIEESQLFIEAAHACHARVVGQES